MHAKKNVRCTSKWPVKGKKRSRGRQKTRWKDSCFVKDVWKVWVEVEDVLDRTMLKRRNP